MGNRTPLIAGNWKMYKTGPEAVDTAQRLVELLADTADVDIMIAPAGKKKARIPEKYRLICWWRPDASM